MDLPLPRHAFPHLETPSVELPSSLPPSPEGSLRYFQSESDPFELIPSLDGRFFHGADITNSLDMDCYGEIGSIGVRTIRNLGVRVRDDFGESRRFLEAITALADQLEGGSSVRFSDANLTSEFARFLQGLPTQVDAIHGFLDVMCRVRRHSVRLERALLRLERTTGDSGVRHLPGFAHLRMPVLL